MIGLKSFRIYDDIDNLYFFNCGGLISNNSYEERGLVDNITIYSNLIAKAADSPDPIPVQKNSNFRLCGYLVRCKYGEEVLSVSCASWGIILRIYWNHLQKNQSNTATSKKHHINPQLLSTEFQIE